MNAQVSSHPAAELRFATWKWLLLMIAAALLAAVWATQAHGVDAPRRVPPDPAGGALPLAPAAPATEAAEARVQCCLNLWLALEQHEHGQFAEAAATWEAIEAPAETRIWRDLALGAAYLELGRTAAAGDLFQAAIQRDAQNAAAHFLLGVTNLRRAQQAVDWEDSLGPAPVRLIAWLPDRGAPNSKAMLEYAAIGAFERAVELAPGLRTDVSLVPRSWGDPGGAGPYMPVAPPTVGHLLASLALDNLGTQAHIMAAQVQIQHGLLEAAEAHLDQASLAGCGNVNGYLSLGDKYAEQGRAGDARRVRLKALQQQRLDGQGVAVPRTALLAI